MASKSFMEFRQYLEMRLELAEWRFREVQVEEQQKREVENVWDNIVENYNYEGVVTCSVLYIYAN